MASCKKCGNYITLWQQDWIGDTGLCRECRTPKRSPVVDDSPHTSNVPDSQKIESSSIFKQLGYLGALGVLLFIAAISVLIYGHYSPQGYQGYLSYFVDSFYTRLPIREIYKLEFGKLNLIESTGGHTDQESAVTLAIVMAFIGIFLFVLLLVKKAILVDQTPDLVNCTQDEEKKQIIEEVENGTPCVRCEKSIAQDAHLCPFCDWPQPKRRA